MEDWVYSVTVTPDGGYIVAGYTLSNGGDVRGKHGGADFWIVKLDKDGNVEWQKCLGGSNDDAAYSVAVTPDGGYIVAGVTWSNDGDVSGNHGYGDFWVVKLDGEGNIVWQRALGGNEDDSALSVSVTPDGGYIVAGYTQSYDGDVKGWHEGYDENWKPYPDFWIVKLGWK